jgi:hypothetical protein
MEAYEIEIGKFYSAKGGSHSGSSWSGIIFIFDVEDYHYREGDIPKTCERYVFCYPSDGEIGTFTYLDTEFIRNLSPLKNQIMTRNSVSGLKRNMDDIKKRFEKRFENLEVGINHMMDDHTLPFAYENKDGSFVRRQD